MLNEKVFKSYESFVNESFFSDKISKYGKRAINAIKKFIGKGANFLNSLVFQSTNQVSKDGKAGTIPIGVHIFPSKNDIAALAEKGITAKIPNAVEIYKNEKTNVNEEVVPLESDPDSNVPNIHEEDLNELISDALNDPDGLPLMIWGAPGIAKTAIVQRSQTAYGGRLIDLQLTTYAPEDFFLPKEDSDSFRKENKFSARATRIPQAWLPVYHESEGEEGDAIANGIDGEGGVLFLDELSRAREAIRNVCLKLVHEKKMDGGWVLGSKWRIIAASNRIMDDPDTNASEFGTALSNRFQNYNFVPTIDDLTKFMTSQGELIDSKIIGFLNWSKGEEYFHKLDPDKGMIAWPSPRTWVEGAKRWKRKEDRINRKLTKKEIYLIMAGHVGTEAADAFIKYITLSEKIDLEKLAKVYTDPENAPLPPTRDVGGEDLIEQDIAYIMAIAIAYEHRYSRLSQEQLKNIIIYTARVNNATTATQILAAVSKVHPYIKADPAKSSDSMVDVYKKFLVQYFLPKYPSQKAAIDKILKDSQTSSQEQQPQNYEISNSDSETNDD